MAVPSGEQMLARFRDAALASSIWGKDRAREAAKLCEVTKAYFMDKMLGAVKSGSARLALVSYQSDGAPMLTQERYVERSGPFRTQRVGGAGDELLVQKAYLRTTTAGGDPVVVTLLRELRPLAAGKSAWCLYTAAAELCPC